MWTLLDLLVYVLSRSEVKESFRTAAMFLFYVLGQLDIFAICIAVDRPSQWPLDCWGLRVRISPASWMSLSLVIVVCCAAQVYALG